MFADLRRAGLPADTEAVIASVGDLLMSNPTVQEAVVSAVASRRVASGIKQAQAHAAKVIKEAKENAANGRKRLSEIFPDWQVSSQIFTGTPAWVLIDAADKLNADLIVVEYSQFHPIFELLPAVADGTRRIVFDYHGVTPPTLASANQRNALIRGQEWAALAGFADASGELHIDPPPTSPGDRFTIEARMPLVAGVTACSAEKSNNGHCTPIDVRLDRAARPVDEDTVSGAAAG